MDEEEKSFWGLIQTFHLPDRPALPKGWPDSLPAGIHDAFFILTGQSSSTGWGAVIFVWFSCDMHASQEAPCGPQQWGQLGVQFCCCSRRPTSNAITHNSCASSSFPFPLLLLLCNSRTGFVIIGGSKSGCMAPTLSDQRNKSMKVEAREKVIYPSIYGLK